MIQTQKFKNLDSPKHDRAFPVGELFVTGHPRGSYGIYYPNGYLVMDIPFTCKDDAFTVATWLQSAFKNFFELRNEHPELDIVSLMENSTIFGLVYAITLLSLNGLSADVLSTKHIQDTAKMARQLIR